MTKNAEYSRRFREKHPGYAAECSRKYRERHPDRIKAARATEHRKAVQREAQKRYREKNRERLREYSRDYRMKYPERAKAADKRWRLAHPEMCKSQNRRGTLRRQMRYALDAAFYAKDRAKGRLRNLKRILSAGRLYKPRFYDRIPDWCVRGGELDARSQFLYANLTPSQRAFARELAIERKERKNQ